MVLGYLLFSDQQARREINNVFDIPGRTGTSIICRCVTINYSCVLNLLPETWTLTCPMALTLNFPVQLLKNLYFRNGKVDWRGTKGIWVNRILGLQCDLDLGFSRSNLKNKLYHMEGRDGGSLAWNERDESKWDVEPTVSPWAVILILDLDFKGQIVKQLYPKHGRAVWHWMKGMQVNMLLDPLFDLDI